MQNMKNMQNRVPVAVFSLPLSLMTKAKKTKKVLCQRIIQDHFLDCLFQRQCRSKSFPQNDTFIDLFFYYSKCSYSVYVLEDFEQIEGVSLLKTFSNWTLDRTNAGLYTRRAKAPDRGGSRPQGSKPVTSSRMKKGKRRKEKATNAIQRQIHKATQERNFQPNEKVSVASIQSCPRMELSFNHR